MAVPKLELLQLIRIRVLNELIAATRSELLDYPLRLPEDLSTRASQFSDPSEQAGLAARHANDHHTLQSAVEASESDSANEQIEDLGDEIGNRAATIAMLEEQLEDAQDELKRRKDRLKDGDERTDESVGGRTGQFSDPSHGPNWTGAPVQSVECHAQATADEVSSLSTPDTPFGSFNLLGVPRLATVNEHDDPGAPLLFHNEEATQSHINENNARSINPYSLQYLFCTKWRSINLVGKGMIVISIIFVPIATLIGLFLPRDHDNHTTPSPTANRTHMVYQCASKLSAGRGLGPTLLNQEDVSPQWKAVNWFVNGAGVNVEVPATTKDCEWGTEFGTLYALMVIRESFHVNNPSWYPALPLRRFSDMCRWARIDCNAEESATVALHFNHANISGTLPLEMFIGLSASLDTLWLYSNDGLTGTLPTEVGLMTNLKHLQIQDTPLMHSIPTSLGCLTLLEELLMDNTSFSGTMPAEVCKLRSVGELQSLHADCGGTDPKVTCEYPLCCTKCFK